MISGLRWQEPGGRLDKARHCAPVALLVQGRVAFTCFVFDREFVTAQQTLDPSLCRTRKSKSDTWSSEAGWKTLVVQPGNRVVLRACLAALAAIENVLHCWNRQRACAHCDHRSEVGRMLSTREEIVFRVGVVRDVSCVRSCAPRCVGVFRDPCLVAAPVGHPLSMVSQIKSVFILFFGLPLHFSMVFPFFHFFHFSFSAAMLCRVAVLASGSILPTSLAAIWLV